MEKYGEVKAFVEEFGGMPKKTPGEVGDSVKEYEMFLFRKKHNNLGKWRLSCTFVSWQTK